MITHDLALLRAANLRVSYTDREINRVVDHLVSLDLSDAKDIILALIMTVDVPVEDLRALIAENSDILIE